MTDRRNKNRGYMTLNVWKDSVDLFVLTRTILKPISFDLLKTKQNVLDASHSIQRNISEGYCRKSPKEYLNFLNYALGSSGELFSSMYSFKASGDISTYDFETFDILHYKTENELLKLAASIQRKIINNEIWDESYT